MFGKSVFAAVAAAGLLTHTDAFAQLALAYFTDPWGTYIELTEGLDAF